MPHEDGTMHIRDAEVEYLTFLGLPITDTNIEQLRVFGQALQIFHSRDKKYGGLWKQYPAETMITHMQSKFSRTEAMNKAAVGVTVEDLDDPLDLLNYTVFYIRTQRDQLLPPV